MHPNPIFRKTPTDLSLDHARNHGFGILSVNGADVPHFAHIPFLMDEDGKSAELHLVRSNPIARLSAQPIPATIVVSGPHSYISPDWYGVPDQVPTWNYTAVHLIGELHPLPDAELPSLLDRLSDHFEAALSPKPIWKREKMTEGAFEKMLRMIRPFRFHIQDVQSTWKLSQNKVDEARVAAAEKVAEAGIGMETAALAQIMKNPPVQE